MTENEFDQLIGFIEIRWPHLRWTSVTTAALFEDLERCDDVDVWAAIHALYEQGLDHAPAPSVIVARALEERHRNAVAERLGTPALPTTTAEMSWSEYAQRIYGEPVGIFEAGRRDHAEFETGDPNGDPYEMCVNRPVSTWPRVCRSPLCDMHGVG